MRSSKAIILGDSNAGKSSLAQRWCDNFFSPDYSLTTSIDFFAKNIEDSRLQLWDIPGGRTHDLPPQHYLRGAKISFIVWDSARPEKYKSAETHLKRLSEHHYPKDFPIIFIGSKADIRKCDWENQVKGIETLARKSGFENFFILSASTATEPQKSLDAKLNHLVKLAMWKMDPNNQGLILLLTSLFINERSPVHTQLPRLPKDLWLHIFFLATGVELNRKKADDLAFNTAKSMLIGSLKRSSTLKNSEHSTKASNFLKTIEVTQDLPQLANAVLTQAKRLKNLPLLANSEEKHNRPIIGIWANRFNPKNQDEKEDENSNNCTIC